MYAITGIEEVTIIDKENEEKEKKYTSIHFFDMDNPINSSIEKGFLIKKFTLNQRKHDINDFEVIPGIYNLNFRPAPNKQYRLSDIEHVKKFNIKEHGDSYLLFHIRKIDYLPEKQKKRIKGTMLTYIDPQSELELESDIKYIRGYLPISSFINNEEICEEIEKVPGYYNMEFEEKTGLKNRLTMQLKSIRMQAIQEEIIQEN